MTCAQIMDQRLEVNDVSVHLDNAVHVGRLLQQLLHAGGGAAQERGCDDDEVAATGEADEVFGHGGWVVGGRGAGGAKRGGQGVVLELGGRGWGVSA